MLISIIFAFAQDRYGKRVIGLENKIPWSCPTDMRRFRQTTTGSPVIMGRKTHESIGRVLPGRQNIIITRDEAYKVDNALVVHSVEDALAQARALEVSESFIIGGAQIYSQTLELADRIYMTEILERGIVGDSFFPPMNLTGFKLLCKEESEAERFELYQRNASGQPRAPGSVAEQLYGS